MKKLNVILFRYFQLFEYFLHYLRIPSHISDGNISEFLAIFKVLENCNNVIFQIINNKHFSLHLLASINEHIEKILNFLSRSIINQMEFFYFSYSFLKITVFMIIFAREI